MPDPITGEILLGPDATVTVTTSVRHGLTDGEEIKVSGLEDQDVRKGSVYAKNLGRRAVALYLDEKCSAPVVAIGGQHNPVRIFRPRFDDHAIVVGINHYPAFEPLGGPEIDAKAFSRWLLSADGGRLPAGNVELILSSRDATCTSEAKPSLDLVHNAFRKHSTEAFATMEHRVGRRLYIFLAGHGITPVRSASPIWDDAALLMANADDTDFQHLPGVGYAEWFRTAGAFDEIVLFADCCRDQKNNVVPLSPTFPILDGGRDRVRVFYAAATGLNAKAWERDFGNPPLRRGIFSFALMETLEQGAVRDENGQLTAYTLMQHLSNRVPQLKAEQKPRFEHVAIPDIVLLERSVEKPPNFQIRFSTVRHGSKVKLIGSKYPKEDDVFQAGPEPINVHLRTGLYRLLAEDGASLNFEVTAGGGQNVKF
jgi:hypothetical protein